MVIPDPSLHLYLHSHHQYCLPVPQTPKAHCYLCTFVLKYLLISPTGMQKTCTWFVFSSSNLCSDITTSLLKIYLKLQAFISTSVLLIFLPYFAA
jgi:hypothetical protein